MANKKFSEFTTQTDTANVQFVVGFNGSDNVKITPANLTGGGGGASDLNGLSDCLVDGNSVYVGEVPSSLSGNPVDNTVLGIDAGQGLTTGFGNTFIGFEAAKLITDSDNMVIIGRQAGNASASNGDRTIAIGYDAHGSSISTDNVAVGYAASQFSGVSYCVAVGRGAALFNGGQQSVSIGPSTNYSNTAQGTVSVGMNAGRSQTSGTKNTNIGFQASYSNTTSGSRTTVGYEAGRYNTQSNNTFIGAETGRGNSNGYTGQQNTAVGARALTNATGGNYNTVIGYAAGDGITNGEWNTIIGRTAASLLTTGDQNVVIGMNTQVSANNAENQIIIGQGATGTADNTIVLGNSSITAFTCQVQTISALSDKRDKTNIESSSYGLDLITQLNPVTFEWNQRDGKRKGLKDLGFIAQELQKYDNDFLQLVNSDNPDKLLASYGRLIPVLVKAVQELKLELDNCKNNK